MYIVKSTLNPSWILLDNWSAVNIFYNPHLITYIHPVKTQMRLHYQSRTITANLKGNLTGYPELVWYTLYSISNVLSLSMVKDTYSVIYGSRLDNPCIVNKLGEERKVKESTAGLY